MRPITMTLSSSEPSTAPPALVTVPSRRARGTKALIFLTKSALFIIVLAFVTYALVQQFKQLRWDEFRFRAAPAALSVLCMLAVSAVQLLMFRTLLGAYGYRLPWPVTMGLAWVPPLGKYVPGKVAAIAGAVHLQRQHGIPGAVAVSVAVMLDGLAVIAGLIASAPLLIFHDALRERFPNAWIWCALLAIAGIALLHPRVFVGLLNVLLRRLHRQPLKVVPSLARFMVPVIASFLQWVFAGLALWFMTRAAVPVAGSDLPRFISIAALAMTFSYLALFAPGGLGVREVLYLITLGPVVGHTAAVVVVAMRIVQTLLEVALAAIGFTMLRRHHRAASRKQSSIAAAPSSMTDDSHIRPATPGVSPRDGPCDKSHS